MINNIFVCYEGETHTRNDNEKNTEITKKPTIDGSKSMEKKLVFADIIRRGALPDEAFIHTIEITALREI